MIGWAWRDLGCSQECRRRLVSEHSAAESTKKKHPATVHSLTGVAETVSSEHQSKSNHGGADVGGNIS